MKLRSVLETSVAVFHSMLTHDNTTDIERISKTVAKIILGTRYTSYEDALQFLNLESLEKRRGDLCLSFALKCLTNPKFEHLFEPTPKVDYKLRDVRKFVVPHCDKSRSQSSTLIYLTHLLN